MAGSVAEAAPAVLAVPELPSLLQLLLRLLRGLQRPRPRLLWLLRGLLRPRLELGPRQRRQRWRTMLARTTLVTVSTATATAGGTTLVVLRNCCHGRQQRKRSC